MINELREQSVPIQEQRSSGGYIHLVCDNDQAEKITEDGFEHIIFSAKSVGHVGQANVSLTRDIVPTESSEAVDLYLSANGITQISRVEATDLRLYRLRVSLDNRSARFRGSSFSVHISIDGQEELIEGALENESEGIEKFKEYKGDIGGIKGSNFTTVCWRTSQNIKAFSLFVSYDPENPEDRRFLQDLYFKFSVVHPSQGGAN